jgi:hypothetical protein
MVNFHRSISDGQVVGQQRRRFWTESCVAAVAAVLFVVTLVWKDWIELVFGVDPDGGDGSLEWAFVAVLALVAVVAGVAARHDWRDPAASFD